MRYDVLVASFLALTELSGTARAQMQTYTGGKPVFDSREASTIARNELLVAILNKDPWLVRRILDVAGEGLSGAERASIESIGLNPDLNPDLVTTRRDALGSVQWIDLLKRAKAEKDGLRDAELKVEPETRSAAGALEMIDMAKRVKAARQTRQ